MAGGATEVHEGSTRASRVAVDALVNRVREELVRNEEQVVSCPDCSATKVVKQFSTFAFAGTASQPRFGSSGGCCGGSCGSC